MSDESLVSGKMWSEWKNDGIMQDDLWDKEQFKKIVPEEMKLLMKLRSAQIA